MDFFVRRPCKCKNPFFAGTNVATEELKPQSMKCLSDDDTSRNDFAFIPLWLKLSNSMCLQESGCTASAGGAAQPFEIISITYFYTSSKARTGLISS